MMDNTTRYVAKQIEERDIRFLRLWFSDLCGNLKSFAVVASDIEDAFEEGIGFDGSSVQGVGATKNGPDLLVVPDANTFQVLPWRPQDNAVARMFCNIVTPDGAPSPGDSRYVLRTVMDKARGMGFVPVVGTEVEYFYFANAHKPEPLDNGNYFDITLDNAADLRRDSILTLEQMGVPVVFSMHESDPSQHQINLHHADALSAADAIMTSRLVIKQIAADHEVHASFMPKPINGFEGSGLYVHESLFDIDGNNVFHDKEDSHGYGLSRIARHYIAGILRHASEMTLITNQYVNSYKRLQPGFDAPTHIFWGTRNKNPFIRIPRFKPNKSEAARIELRAVDAATNPYLALAVTIAAGLRGIEEKLEPPEAFEDDIFSTDAHILQKKGVVPLPSDLSRAIDAFEHSALMKEVLGDYMHAEILAMKQQEWEQYRNQVTQWEIDRYLPKL